MKLLAGLLRGIVKARLKRGVVPQREKGQVNLEGFMVGLRRGS